MAMMSGRAAVPYVKQLIPAGTIVATAGTITGGAAGAGLTWIMTGLAPYDYLQAVLEVTAAATEAGDTMDVYLDTSFNGGATWINAARFTTLLGNGGAKKEAITISPFSATGTTPINVAADCASGTVRHLLGDQIRIRVVTVDVATLANISFTFGLSIDVA